MLTIMPSSTSRAGVVVCVLMEEASAARIALWSTSAILRRVDVNSACGALKKTGIADGPANNLDWDTRVGKSIKADELVHPLLDRTLQCYLHSSTLCLCNRLRALPTDTEVEVSLVRHDLIVAVVLEAQRIGIGRHLMIPYLLKGCHEVGWWTPSTLTLAE